MSLKSAYNVINNRSNVTNFRSHDLSLCLVCQPMWPVSHVEKYRYLGGEYEYLGVATGMD